MPNLLPCHCSHMPAKQLCVASHASSQHRCILYQYSSEKKDCLFLGILPVYRSFWTHLLPAWAVTFPLPAATSGYGGGESSTPAAWRPLPPSATLHCAAWRGIAQNARYLARTPRSTCRAARLQRANARFLRRAAARTLPTHYFCHHLPHYAPHFTALSVILHCLCLTCLHQFYTTSALRLLCGCHTRLPFPTYAPPHPFPADVTCCAPPVAYLGCRTFHHTTAHCHLPTLPASSLPHTFACCTRTRTPAPLPRLPCLIGDD